MSTVLAYLKKYLIFSVESLLETQKSIFGEAAVGEGLIEGNLRPTDVGRIQAVLAEYLPLKPRVGNGGNIKDNGGENLATVGAKV